jgi:hypothetical protein
MTTQETINALQSNLTKALVEREDAQAKIDESNKAILAIRNVLAGVQLGQQLAAEAAPKESPTL